MGMAAKVAPDDCVPLMASNGIATNGALADPAAAHPVARQVAEPRVVVTAGGPEQFGALVQAQTEIASGVIRAAGIKPGRPASAPPRALGRPQAMRPSR